MDAAVTDYTTKSVRLGKTVRLEDDELMQLDIFETGFGLTWSSGLSAGEFVDVTSRAAVIGESTPVTLWRPEVGESTVLAGDLVSRYSQMPREQFWADCFFVRFESEGVRFSWESLPRTMDEHNMGALVHGAAFVSINPRAFEWKPIDAYVRSTATKKVVDALDELWSDYLLKNLEEYVDHGSVPLWGGHHGVVL